MITSSRLVLPIAGLVSALGILAVVRVSPTFFTEAATNPSSGRESVLTVNPSIVTESMAQSVIIRVVDDAERSNVVSITVVHKNRAVPSDTIRLNQISDQPKTFEKAITPSDSKRPNLFAPGVHAVWYRTGFLYGSAQTTYEVKRTPIVAVSPSTITGMESKILVAVDYVPASTVLAKTPGGTPQVELWFSNDEQKQVNPQESTAIIQKVFARQHFNNHQRYEYIVTKKELDTFPNGKITIEAFDVNHHTLAMGIFEIKRKERCEQFLNNGSPNQKYDILFNFQSSQKNIARSIVASYVGSALREVEPFRSNMDKLNVWYRILNEEQSKKYDSALRQALTSTYSDIDLQYPELRSICGNGTADVTILFNPFKGERSFHREYTHVITFYAHTRDESKRAMTTFLHELGHAFGLYEEYVEVGRIPRGTVFPNCSSTPSVAPWSDMVTKRPWMNSIAEAAGHVGFYTGDPATCYQQNDPINDCALVQETPMRNAFVFTALASRQACLAYKAVGSDQRGPLYSSCMFKEGETYYCRVGSAIQDCESFSQNTAAPKTGGCVAPEYVRPHVFSLMNKDGLYGGAVNILDNAGILTRRQTTYISNFSRSFGPVNERQICRKLQEVTGATKKSFGRICQESGL